MISSTRGAAASLTRAPFAGVVCAALLLAPLLHAQRDPKCPRLTPVSLFEQTHILADDDSKGPECTAFLIVLLGSSRYMPALPIIVRLLDFEWPDPNHPDLPTHSYNPLWRYPAVRVLADDYQEVAAPAIIEFLATAKPSPLARSHASYTLLWIYSKEKPEEAVKVLVRASRASKDPAAAARLWDAAVATEQECQRWRRDSAAACHAALTPASPPR